MRTLTKVTPSKEKNSIGENANTGGYEESTIIGVFTPIGVVARDQRRIGVAPAKANIIVRESTHILYYDHNTYSLTVADQIKDESDNTYKIKQIEPVPDFGGVIDHYTAFLALQQ